MSLAPHISLAEINAADNPREFIHRYELGGLAYAREGGAIDYQRIEAIVRKVVGEGVGNQPRAVVSSEDSNDALLTLKEAREFAKIKRTTMWKWVDQLDLRTVTVHGVKRVRRGDLLEFLRQHESGETRKRSK